MARGPRGEPVRYGPVGQQQLLYAEWEGLDETRTRLKRVRGMLVQASENVAETVKDIAVEAMQEEAPVGKTGKLRDNIYGRVMGVPSGFSLEIISGMYYSKWVIKGRGPVYPKYRKSLKWETKGGDVVFAMSAKPTKPNPFHKRGWRRARPRIEKAVEADMKDLIAVLED